MTPTLNNNSSTDGVFVSKIKGYGRGDIIVVKLDEGWVPHVVEDDKSLSAICDCDGDMITLNFDGDDADGIEEGVEFVIYDGGSAAGI